MWNAKVVVTKKNEQITNEKHSKARMLLKLIAIEDIAAIFEIGKKTDSRIWSQAVQNS